MLVGRFCSSVQDTVYLHADMHMLQEIHVYTAQAMQGARLPLVHALHMLLGCTFTALAAEGSTHPIGQSGVLPGFL